MNNYYAPFQRPIGYYNPSIPNGQEMTAYSAVYASTQNDTERSIYNRILGKPTK